MASCELSWERSHGVLETHAPDFVGALSSGELPTLWRSCLGKSVETSLHSLYADILHIVLLASGVGSRRVYPPSRFHHRPGPCAAASEPECCDLREPRLERVAVSLVLQADHRRAA